MTETQLCERDKRLLAMGVMAASLAHEIRNPLGSMEIYCSLLRRDLQDKPESLALIENLAKGIRNLERVVANSLQFAKDARVRRRKITNIKKYLDEILIYVEPLAKEKNIRIAVIAEEDHTETSDPFQLQQVITNIVMNAIEATSVSQSEIANPCVRVKSNILCNGDWEIQVTDRGVGIEEADIDRIFDPFYSTKARGTGLGMTIAYSIVKAHGGEINIRSKLRYGTTVSVLLHA